MREEQHLLFRHAVEPGEQTTANHPAPLDPLVGIGVVEQDVERQGERPGVLGPDQLGQLPELRHHAPPPTPTSAGRPTSTYSVLNGSNGSSSSIRWLTQKR